MKAKIRRHLPPRKKKILKQRPTSPTTNNGPKSKSARRKKNENRVLMTCRYEKIISQYKSNLRVDLTEIIYDQNIHGLLFDP